jgi:hypothetical protein
MHGAYTQQVYTNLKGYPGREITVGAINDKPDSGAIVRIYAVDNYVYIVSAVGDKSWLQTPAVSKFLDSFEFFGGWGTWQDGQGWQHWQDERGWEHWHDADHHEHWWDAEHREHWVDAEHREHIR